MLAMLEVMLRESEGWVIRQLKLESECNAV